MGEHERPLGRHPLADGDPLVVHHRDRHPRLPGSRRDHRRDPFRQLVPDPGHRPDVGERQGREPPVTRRGESVGAVGHRAQGAMIEDRTLRQARGAARPDHGDRIGGVEAGGRTERWPRACGDHLRTGDHRPRARRAARAVLHHGDRRSSPSQYRALLLRAESQVDARGDRTESERGRVADHVVDRARKEKTDHRAAGDAALGEERGHPVGGTIPLGEGQRLAARPRARRLDVRLDVAVVGGSGSEEVDDRLERTRNLTARHIGCRL